MSDEPMTYPLPLPLSIAAQTYQIHEPAGDGEGAGE